MLLLLLMLPDYGDCDGDGDDVVAGISCQTMQ